MAKYNLYKDGEFVNAIEADLMFTMAYCQTQGFTFEEIPFEQINPEPTEEDDTAAMLVDHEYRLTLLELGLTE